MIPLGILFFSNLCICGLFFTPYPPLPEESPPKEVDSVEDNEEIESNGHYETDSIGWNKNIVILSPRRENPDNTSEPNEENNFVNEENTPIFLNAVAGLFFPICYSEASSHSLSANLPHLLSWQSRFFKVHILVINVLLLIAVTTVFVLVSSVPSFNYNYNVMNFLWFRAASAFLGLQGVTSFVMSLDTEISELANRVLQWFGSRERRSNVKEDLWKKTYTCLFGSLLVSLPAILGLVFFHTSPPPRPLLLVAKSREGAKRELHVIGASVPASFQFVPSGQVIEGEITNTCNASQPITTKILVLNLTEPACRRILNNQEVLTTLLNKQVSAVVVLDDSESPAWRVSSPHSELDLLARVWPSCNLLLVRRQDWAGMEKQMSSGAKLTISKDSNFEIEDLNMFQCSIESPLLLEVINEDYEGRNALLHRNGKVTQEVTVSVHCTSYGVWHLCNKWNIPESLTWGVQCKHIRDVNVKLFNSANSQAVPSLDIVLRNNETFSICCHNRYTFVKVFSTHEQLIQSSVVKTLTNCTYSDFIDESCKGEYGLLTRSRFCKNGEFIIKEYTRVLCANNATIQNSCDPTYDC